MSADTLISSWLTTPGWDSPAGPLFIGGEYAESEIAMGSFHTAASAGNTGCGQCTGSICNGRRILCN